MSDIEFLSGTLLFMWDEDKAITNWQKHRVTFETATRVFHDRYAVILPDFEHSDGERRQRIIGTALDTVSHVKILFIVYVERVLEDEADVIRIISARNASKKEAKIYERCLPK